MTINSKGINDLTSIAAKTYADMNALFTGYISAAAQSNAAVWQGIQDISHNLSGIGQETFARTVDAGTTLMSARTPQQAAETHSDYIKNCFDNIVAGSNKLSEISVRAAKSTIDPLAQHANDALGEIMKKSKVG